MTDEQQNTGNRPPVQPRVGLASASPRREALLRSLCVEPVVTRVDVDESRDGEEPVVNYVRRLALDKARQGARRVPSLPMLGGDTIVCLGERAFGKPADGDDARRMLSTLSGKTHVVHSAVAIVHGVLERVMLVSSSVTFAALSQATIDDYIATGEPADKAGAYAIQGLAACFICDLQGSYSAVMGMPLRETSQLLAVVGIDVFEIAAGRNAQ